MQPLLLWLSFGLTLISPRSTAPLFEEPTGIQFFRGSWQQALTEAKRQNKPLFVDFYTTWCPPCKRMAREAFPNPRIGEKFNARFVNYQLNAEYGEGLELAKRYAVASYPTALYVTPNGEVVHRSVGYAGIPAMIQQADLVLAMPKMRRAVGKRKRSAAQAEAALPADSAQL